MHRPTIGSVVGGKYKVVRAIGEGGMGAVYEAEHLLTLRHVALKWVHPQTNTSEQARDRLLHEARATSRIRHRNVVDVYDVLQDGDAVCLVMQLLVGEPLSELIARDALPLHEFIGLLVPVMRGVAAAHAAGVVHRDIKPENIILANEAGQPLPVPKLIDFGISKVFDAEGPHLTRSGVTMGTPKYVSYEQLLGARDVDERTDIYSFGVMLYEAITGEPPYRASSFGEQAVAFATSVPSPVRRMRPELPVELAVVVEQAIAKQRSERLPDMLRFIELLEPFSEASAFPTPLASFPVQERTGDAGHKAAATTVDIGPAPASSHTDAPLDLPWSEPPPSVRRRRVRLGAPRVLLYGLALVGGLVLVVHAMREPVPSSSTAHAAAQAETASVAQAAAELSGPAADLRPEPAANLVDAGPQAAPADSATTDGSADETADREVVAPARDTEMLPRRKRAAARTSPAEQLVSPAPAEPTRADDADALSTHRAGKLARDEF